jgi:hypothetical protein
LSELGTRSPHERLEQAMYDSSYKRLKRHGLGEDGAARIAGEVARQVAARTKAPDFGSQDELAVTVLSVCKALSEGKSYYDLIGERPYLVTGRIDRLVSAAARVRPEVPADIAAAARRATALERLSGGLAVLFTAAALAAVGIWYALAVGVFVSAGSEFYVQTGMPPSARRLVSRYHLPRWLGLLAVLLLVWAGYSWLDSSPGYHMVKGWGIALFGLLVIAVVPGFTLAVLVGLRERKWRGALEKELVARGPEYLDPEDLDPEDPESEETTGP